MVIRQLAAIHGHSSLVTIIITVCAVLAPDSWNSCSLDQGLKAQHICKIAQSSSYS